jgi:NTE family protein
MKKDIHLVLGSGGARGLAHIGVINALEYKGYTIKSIAGCSMGAVVGGIYAAGALEEYTQWMLTLTKSKVFSLFDVTFNKSGFLKGEKVFEVINQMVHNPNIEDFNIPFTAVSVDIFSQKEIWFSSGDLQNALRASIAIPGFFIPVHYNQMLLVDGGVLNPLPLNAVSKNTDNELIIAVDLNGQLSSKSRKIRQKKMEDDNLFSKILSYLPIKTNDVLDEEEVLSKGKSIAELLANSYNLTQDRVTELMIKLYKPDILLEIPRDSCSIFDFHKTKIMMELGYELAMKKIEEFENETIHVKKN